MYNSALKKAKGRKSLAASPLPYIQSIAHSAILSAEKNKTKMKFLHFVLQNEDIGREHNLFGFKKLWFVQSGKDGDGNDLWSEVYVRPAQELFDAKKAKQYVQDRYRLQRSTKEQQEREIIVYEDGQAYRLWVSEPKIAASINREISEDLPSVLKTIKALTNMRTGVMTKFNPNFATRNLARDLQTAAISNMGTGLNPLFMGNFGNPKMHAAIWGHITGKKGDGKYDKLLHDFFTDGAQTGYTFLKDLEHIKKDIEKELHRGARYYTRKSWEKTLNGLSALSEWSELSIRFAEYCAARDKGYSRFQATIAAKNVSVNFNRHGSNKYAGAFFGFWNANVQGTRKVFEILGRKGLRGISSVGTLLFVGGFINSFFFPDDDDDERAWSEYDRMQNICIGNVKIPLAQGFRMFWAAGAQAGMAANGSKSVGAAMTEAITYSVGESLPLDILDFIEWNDETQGGLTANWKKAVHTIVPTFGQPVYEIATNMKYTGARIHPEPFTSKQEGTIPKTFLGRDDVNPLLKSFTDYMLELGGGDRNVKSMYLPNGKKLSGGFDYNPSNIQHLIGGYTSGTGMLFLDMAHTIMNASEKEFDLSTVPIANQFYKPYNENILTGKAKQNAYQIINSYESRISALKKAIKEADNYKDKEKYRKELQDLKNAQNEKYRNAKKEIETK
jgi:hypothetical protein